MTIFSQYQLVIISITAESTNSKKRYLLPFVFHRTIAPIILFSCARDEAPKNLFFDPTLGVIRSKSKVSRISFAWAKRCGCFLMLPLKTLK